MPGYHLLLLAFVAFCLSGCSGENPVVDDPEPIYSIQVLSGDNQVGFQGSELPAPVVVRVVDQSSEPQARVKLTAQAIGGGSRVLNPVLRTDSAGRIEIDWVLGSSYSHRLNIAAFDQPAAAVIVSAVARYRYEVPEQTFDGWPVGSLDLDHETTQLIFDGVDEIRKGTYPEVHSLLISHAGRLVFEEYFSGHDSQGLLIAWDRNKPHEVQSASKSFRSMLVGIAIDKGFISGEDALVASFFPEHGGLFEGDKANISLNHLLSMSSGLDWNEWDFPLGDTRNTLSTMYTIGASGWAEYVLSRPLAYEPGTKFVYNTGASIMLNQIVIGSTNATFRDFVKTYYADLVESSRLPGVGYPLSGLTLPRDMAKFGQVYHDNGMWMGTRVVSEEWVARSFKHRFKVNAVDGYGYQWWIRTLQTASQGYTTYYASGNGGQFVFVVRDLDLVIVSTGGNFGSPTMNQMMPFLESFVLQAFE